MTSVFNAEVGTDSSPSDTFGRSGVIAGVAAAVVLLLALIVVALYFNYHSTSVSAFYLIQVSNRLSTSTRYQQIMFLFEHQAPFLVSFSDARTVGQRGSFRSNSLDTQKWRKAKKKAVLLKLGRAEDKDGNLDQHFFYQVFAFLKT